MSRPYEDGFTSVTMKGTNFEWRLPLADFERVKRAWQNGDTFLDFVGFYGSDVSLKLACVESVERCSPEAMAARKAEDEAQRADDAISGGA